MTVAGESVGISYPLTASFHSCGMNETAENAADHTDIYRLLGDRAPPNTIRS